MKPLSAATLLLVCAVAVSLHAQQPAVFVRALDDPRDRREVRGDLLDTPVFPGSIVKMLSLVSALEAGIITPRSQFMCRRAAQADGRAVPCAHPDLRRPLSPAEALAYSCNDFFVSLAPKLSRESLNVTRVAAGLPPIAGGTPLASAIIGMAGPKATPRSLIDMAARLTASGKDTAVPMQPQTRAVLIDGLRGAASYGTAAAFKAAGIPALAKTGSILMPNGITMGLVVALMPADKPARAIVVAAPGASGSDAAAIAADEWGRERSERQRPAALARPPDNRRDTAGAVIRLGRSAPGGAVRVETLRLDDYIAQVLAGEGQPKAGDAAQQALAITARTFALANRNRHRREGFDLCDTTHCQVVRAATPVTRRAADTTSGRVLLHQGQPAFVFYSAWCGGQLELASQVWPGATDYAASPTRHDDACEDEPGWVSEVRVEELERALRAAGLRGSRLRELRVLTRNPSKRVARLAVDGFTPNEITGHDFRMAVGRVAGWQSIKSTSFEIDRTSTGYRFKGVGFGHGVGLCVVGAGKRALQGATAEQILRFYFPGLTIGGAPSAMTSTTAVVAPPPAVTAASTPDVALALPAAEERERAALLSLIRRSRDDIARLTATPAPARLRVTVHSTVESFGRATGQPWWVSGAADGAQIDLLPIAVLRQQGQLERTIRHEVAHALLDAALSKRPMWVREGAAAYFSRPQPTPPAPASRGSCPSDEELLRPLSVGAQRDAYARAEACFARAIADGKRWDQVR